MRKQSIQSNIVSAHSGLWVHTHTQPCVRILIHKLIFCMSHYLKNPIHKLIILTSNNTKKSNITNL